MVRKLKIFQTSIGFFDLAIAAPSMKAAAEAWGADTDIFHQGVAKQTDDPAVVKATMAEPGVVLRRPVGSHGKYMKNPSLPKAPKSRKAANPESQDQEKKREDAKRQQNREKADVAFADAQRRHEGALRSLKQRRDKLATAEAHEEERWQDEQRAHQSAAEGSR